MTTEEKEQLKDLPAEEQIKAMREWFLGKYKDPAKVCPYESAEDSYIYIWGGPYYADDELEAEFGNSVESEKIMKLVNELDNTSYGWSAIPEDKDDPQLSPRPDKTTPAHMDAEKKAGELERITQNLSDSDDDEIKRYMVYAHCVSIIETFLREEFENQLFSDDSYLNKLFQNNKDFEGYNIPFDKKEDMKDLAHAYLSGISWENKSLPKSPSWHNLPKIRKLYNDVLGVRFRNEIDVIYKAVTIIHRYRQASNGCKVTVSKKDIEYLLSKIIMFVRPTHMNVILTGTGHEG